jgi:hypothetical protein
METDGPKIRLSDDLESVRKEVINTVLLELASMSVIKKIESAEKSIWILTQSFDSFNQSVVLSAGASEVIADTINDFREANDIPGDTCDKTKITEMDIMNLVNICHALLESGSDDFDDDGETAE